MIICERTLHSNYLLHINIASYCQWCLDGPDLHNDIQNSCSTYCSVYYTGTQLEARLLIDINQSNLHVVTWSYFYGLPRKAGIQSETIGRYLVLTAEHVLGIFNDCTYLHIRAYFYEKEHLIKRNYYIVTGDKLLLWKMNCKI